MDTMQNNQTERVGLTLEKARQMFSNQTMVDGSEFAIIRSYYDPNVRFRDAIQEIHGRDELIEMMSRFLKRCRDLDVRVNDSAQSGNVMFLQWTMTMRFGRAPRSSIEGATKLTLNAAGQVIEHRDYFDLWGDTLDSLPTVGRLYRKLVRSLG
jgi:limonene-1,2-epoxide hydrolase